jgi:FkbM family methyltransferase
MPPSATVEKLAWVARTFPRLPGNWRLVRWLDEHAAALAALPPQTVRFGRGLRMCVDPHDENGRRVFLRGYEPHERLTRHFVRLLRAGDAALDVGANMGYYTLVAALQVGSRGCVHAFEPAPDTLRLLRANAGLNPAAPITVHAQAVSDHCGETRFFAAPADRSGYSSLRDLGLETQSVHTVPCIALDSLLDELPPVRLIKIDVEGAELRVLRGMRGLIARDRPHIIIEVCDAFLRQLGADAAQVCAHLRGAGYDLHQIVARGALLPVHAAPEGCPNLLATPRAH